MARVSPWHAVEGYGRSSRAHTYAHATAHTHIHDERLRYLGALKCTAPSAPARRRIRKQSPHHAPLLRTAAPSCPFLPPPLPSARLSPPRVERHRRARRRRTANPPHPCRRRSRRGTTRPRTHAGLPHPPLHIILRRRPSPPPGSRARHNTLRMPLRPRPRTHRPRTRRPRSTHCRQQLLLRNLHARHRAQPPPRHLPRLHAARRSSPSRGTAHRGAKVRSPPGGAPRVRPCPAAAQSRKAPLGACLDIRRHHRLEDPPRRTVGVPPPERTPHLRARHRLARPSTRIRVAAGHGTAPPPRASHLTHRQPPPQRRPLRNPPNPRAVGIQHRARGARLHLPRHAGHHPKDGRHRLQRRR